MFKDFNAKLMIKIAKRKAEINQKRELKEIIKEIKRHAKRGNGFINHVMISDNSKQKLEKLGFKIESSITGWGNTYKISWEE